jgi:hypothetical protein
VPDDPAGEAACGAGLAGAGALDLGRGQAGLGGQGVEDLEDVAQLCQQLGPAFRAGGLVGLL